MMSETKIQKIINLFRGEEDWNRGLEYGLTAKQIANRLEINIYHGSSSEIWLRKQNLYSLLGKVKRKFSKEKMIFDSLITQRGLPCVYFIAKTEDERMELGKKLDRKVERAVHKSKKQKRCILKQAAEHLETLPSNDPKRKAWFDLFKKCAKNV